MEEDITDRELSEIAKRKREDIDAYRREPGPERVGDMVGDTLSRIGNRGKGTEKAKGKTTRVRKPYLFNIIPRWLVYSGLPEKLNQEFGLHAWAIFSCLISLDCRFNPGYPDWFDQTYDEIASLTGLSSRSISRYIRKFEKAKLIRLVRGKFKGSKSRFKVNDFAMTPISPNKILYRNGGLLGGRGKKPYLRYYQRVLP